MNSLVIFFSKFGNTKLIAEAIAETLVQEGSVLLRNSGNLNMKDFDGIDLVVMGSPTHKMNLPKAADQVLDELPKKLLKGKFYTAFDTSYKMSWWFNQFTASKRLSPKLGKLGGKRIVSPEIFHVKEREGPLFDGELERAQEWGALILAKIKDKYKH